MDRPAFENKPYFRPLRALYWGSLAAGSAFLIVLGFVASDVEPAGIFWAGVLASFYWLLHRLFYFILFREPFRLPRRPF
ncbi:MAG TPA: hypothetical protein PK523_08130 [Elusimicrobiales bacterium]|nr:hypothetical protein [Elusimicrobiales bacterium]